MRFVVLACGGRDFRDIAMVRRAFEGLPEKPSLVVHGGARGADQLVGQFARQEMIHTAEIKPLWVRGKQAGHDRNRVMLDVQPHLVLAFPGGAGTANMVQQARDVGLHVIEVKYEL